MKRSPLKRRRRAPLPFSDQEARLNWRKGRHVCAICSRSQANGVLVDCHHVIPQRVLRRWVNEQVWNGAIESEEEQATLRRVLWDRRNRMPLCRPDHDAVERRRLVLTRDQVSDDTWAFARELGLDWWLERFCNGELEAA